MTATDAIKKKALELGFDKVGVTTPDAPPEARHFGAWIAQGMHGEMEYMAQGDRTPRPWVRSVVCVLKNYFVKAPRRQRDEAVISKYALGHDYHDVIKDKLRRLCRFIESLGGRAAPCVDTSPILEKPYARKAGLGWIGKNSNLLTKNLGSFFFLGEIMTDLELQPDRPYARNYCGTCTRCIDLCPTEAIVAPYVVDSRRCISYLTIEYRGVIPRELRPLMGNLVFGCDICQDVCPWNRFAKLPARNEFDPKRDLLAPKLAEFMSMTPDEFRLRFKNSPIKRAKRDGFLRNVAVALGNSGSEEAVEPLTRGLNDASWLVRLHSAWALGHLGFAEGKRALRTRLEVEEDSRVREEIERALG